MLLPTSLVESSTALLPMMWMDRSARVFMSYTSTRHRGYGQASLLTFDSATLFAHFRFPLPLSCPYSYSVSTRPLVVHVSQVKQDRAHVCNRKEHRAMFFGWWRRVARPAAATEDGDRHSI